MPIKYSEKKGWYIDKPTEAEAKSLYEIGKMMVIKGLAGAYTNENYKEWLMRQKDSEFFNA